MTVDGRDPRLEIHLDRRSTVDQVRQAVRNQIEAGLREPASALRESRLADEIGVARNTVREALRGLIPLRLVAHHRNKGFAVAQLDAAGVTDVYANRLVIETAAVPVAELPARNRAEMEDALRELERAVEERDWALVFSADRRFHAGLVEVLGSPRLSAFFWSIISELRLVVQEHDRLSARSESLVDDHRRLLDTLASRSREEAITAVTSHLVRSRDQVLASLQGPASP